MNRQHVKFKTLIIVESPSKCRTIEKLLGPGYMCVASCGHIREISDGLNGLHLDTIFSNPEWMPTYTTITKKLHHIRSIKAAISECNGTILLGTDADREGEAIAWHICQHFALPLETTPRITFNEITQTALEHAIRTPRLVDMQLVHAQQARQVLDLMIGYKITPLLWKTNSVQAAINPKKPKKQILSAGRCQTPALRLIYDNDVENRAMSLHPNYCYKCVAYFTSHNIGFSLSHELKLEEIEPFLKFYTNADNIQHMFRVDPDLVRMTHQAPAPLKTSTLQQLANSKYGLTSSETMESAQLLYERGLITYHRTDVTQLSEEFRDKVSQYIERKWGKEYAMNDSQSSVPHLHAHAHEAIRPIDVTLTVDKAKIISRSSGGDDMTVNECRIYHLVWMRTVQSCMRPALCDKLTARISALSGREPPVYEYTHNAFRPVFAGWRACDPSECAKHISDSEDTNDVLIEEGENVHSSTHKSYFDFLMALKPGSLIQYNTISCITKLRNGPKHYTEGGLIKRMEQVGIGRPSTFASIMHTLRKREFVIKRDIIRNIGTHFDCVNYNISRDGKVTASGPKMMSHDRGRNDDNHQYEFGIERNKLQLTDAGRMVIEALIPRCDSLFAYDYTTKMEVALDTVAGCNDDNWRDVCKTCLRDISAVILAHSNSNVSDGPSCVGVSKNDDECSGSGVLRIINKYASVRDGKYGAYIFYKPPKYKKPKFVSLKGFPHNALKCEDTVLVEWIEEHP